MQKGNIGVTTENIFPVIKKFLYSDHEIFLREMVSNAVDATQKLKTLAAQGDYKEELGDLLPKDKVPLDWMEHKAPKYRLTDSGYVLWNNGWNRTDEGGIRGKSTKEGDWVWEIAKDKSVNEEK